MRLACSEAHYEACSEALHEDGSLLSFLQGLLAPRLSTKLACSKSLYEARSVVLYEALHKALLLQGYQ